MKVTSRRSAGISYQGACTHGHCLLASAGKGRGEDFTIHHIGSDEYVTIRWEGLAGITNIKDYSPHAIAYAGGLGSSLGQL